MEKNKTQKYIGLLSVMLLLMFGSNEIYAWTGRNILEININESEEILIEGQLAILEDIKDIVKEFILNPRSDYMNSEQKEIVVDLLGVIKVSKGIVSIQTSRNTTYAFYLLVNNEVEKAYNEMRKEFSLAKFKTEYKCLGSRYKKVVDKCIPKIISEAEPRYVWREGQLVRSITLW